MRDMGFTKKRILVKVTKSSGWYKKGDVHEVGAYLTYGYVGEKPHFEKFRNHWGISIYHCKPILTRPTGHK